MEKWAVKKVFYYEVDNKKFYNKVDADEYALKIFLIEEITKIWKKCKLYNDYSIRIGDDNKTIIVHIHREPYYDNWNVGHYGCTQPKIIDRSTNEKYNTIQDFCKSYSSAIKKIFDIADSIDIEKMSMIYNEDEVNKAIVYKDMVEEIKKFINKI